MCRNVYLNRDDVTGGDMNVRWPHTTRDPEQEDAATLVARLHRWFFF